MQIPLPDVIQPRNDIAIQYVKAIEQSWKQSPECPVIYIVAVDAVENKFMSCYKSYDFRDIHSFHDTLKDKWVVDRLVYSHPYEHSLNIIMVVDQDPFIVESKL